MPNSRPPILPNLPKRPNTSKAEATKPSIPKPDTFPFPKLEKKLPNISKPFPPVRLPKNVPMPPHVRFMVETPSFTPCRASPAWSTACSLSLIHI